MSTHTYHPRIWDPTVGTVDGAWLSDLDKKAALRLYGVVRPEERP